MIQLGDSNGNAFMTDVLAQNQNLTALNSAVTSTLRGQSTAVVQVTGTFVATLSFEGTVDGTNFFAVNFYPFAGGTAVTSVTTTGQWIAVVAGLVSIRTRVSAFTSGTAVVSQNVSQGTNEQAVAVSFPAQASTTAGQQGPLNQGAVTTAAPTYTTAQTNPLSLTTAGGLRTDQSSQAGTAITSVPVAAGTGTLTGNAPVVNAALFVGTAAVTTAAAGVPKVGIVGGAAGAAIDGAIAAAPPANALQIAPKAASANPTAATAGNAVAMMADLSGKLVVTPVAPRLLVKHQATAVAVATETTIVTAGAAGVFNDVTKIIVTTAVATAGTLTFRDVTAGGTPFIINYPNAALAPGSPLVLDFPVPLQQGTAASAWTITNSQAVAINVTVQYVQRVG